MSINRITTEDQLEAVNGSPNPATMAKKISSLEQHARAFIARCPFAVLATHSEHGTDASPRGDGPGFIQVLDDQTLLIPERPGNRIADSLRNIMANPKAALLMMIPGMNETLRVNGQAWITDHGPYLQTLAVAGKPPKLAIVLEVEELYFHCPKAYIRSKLWEPEHFMDRSDLPSMGRMLLEQIQGQSAADEAAANLDQRLEQDVRDNLY